MDDSSPDPGAGLFIEITVRIPDELARLVGARGAVERRMLEALALDEFRQGNLTKSELGRILGFDMQTQLDAFLAAHEAVATNALDDASRARGRQAAANIIARRKGVTLGGLSIKDLINEGRP